TTQVRSQFSQLHNIYAGSALRNSDQTSPFAPIISPPSEESCPTSTNLGCVYVPLDESRKKSSCRIIHFALAFLLQRFSEGGDSSISVQWRPYLPQPSCCHWASPKRPTSK